MNKKFVQPLLLIFTIGMITVNTLANILPFNGVTTAEVSNKLQSFFVPAGYVFSIWGVIYLLLLGFSIGYFYLSKTSQAFTQKITPLYLLSCILNATWIVLWHYGYFLTTVVVMITLLLCLIAIYQELTSFQPTTPREKYLVQLPFSVYLAWICVATIANISGVLWLLHWNGFGISGQIWSAIMMWVAGLLATATAYLRKDLAFSLVIGWAIVGILLKFSSQTIMLYAGGSILVVMALTWILIKFKLSSKKSKSDFKK